MITIFMASTLNLMQENEVDSLVKLGEIKNLGNGNVYLKIEECEPETGN